MLNCYLAGFISGNKIKECLEWRTRIRNHYEHWKNGEKYPISWLDPLNGKEFGTITKDGLKSNIPPKAIVHGDFMSVSKADLIIANMDTFGEKRPCTGTHFELAWAWMLRKPVIMITDNIYYTEHPFIKDTVSVFVKNVDELLKKKVINYFFKRIHSAIY